MSIRIIALYAAVATIAVFAWKDWFKSLCALIVSMAIMGHEDMPKNIAGIQGLSLWNALFFLNFLVYILSRRNQGLRWDMPIYVNSLLLLDLMTVVVGVLWAIFDRGSLEEDVRVGDLISEELINTIKWVFPGLLVYDGCRTRNRAQLILFSVLILQFVIAAQVVKKMPMSQITGEMDQQWKHRRTKLIGELGFSADDMSTVLAGTSWGIVAALPLFRKWKPQRTPLSQI